MSDLVLGPGQDGKTIEPEGWKASEMKERQRAMLLDVLSEWAGIYSRERGGPAMHVHTMYRDPTNDYGRKFIAK
ncbi:MAG: DUF3500 domain-containing protein [Acidobacteriota bacterium]|nr:DUF3500 domain-containing protein [Acidobacteriota bacterium]